MPSSNPMATAHPGAGTCWSVDLTNEAVPNSLSGASIAANTITSASIAKGLLQGAVVNLTATQIKAMSVTPVTLIAAPGAGLSIVLYQVLFRITTTATAFANGGAVVIQYHSSAVAATGTVAAAVVNAAAGTYDNVMQPISAAIAAQNDPIEITNASAPFITGTGTAQVHLRYFII